MMMAHFRIIGLLILLLPSCVFADVSLPRLISDGLILQRDTTNIIWGWANNGEKITLKMNGEIVGTTVTHKNNWSINMPAQSKGGPHVIEVLGNNTVAVDDVYFGDVWIASGQSNMQTTMDRVSPLYPKELAEANYPQIRHFVVPGEYNYEQAQNDLSGGQWLAVNTQTIRRFSAVAHFFSTRLHEKYNVPIGIINSSFGGSPAEAWMSESALKQFPHYLDVINKFRQKDYLKTIIAADKKNNDDWYHKLNSQDLGLQGQPWYDNKYNAANWENIEIPSFWQDAGVKFTNGAIWFKKEFTLTEADINNSAMLNLGTIVDADRAYVNGIDVGSTGYKYPPRRYNVKKGILKAGVNIITVRVISNSGKGGFIKDKPYFLKTGNKKIDLFGTWQYKIGVELSPTPNSKFSKYTQPLGFYNSMLSPLLQTSITGVIWYQGESNTGRAKEYYDLFPAMIQDWRHQFNQGDFPFIFVQLANFMEEKQQPSESGWAETREAQRLTLKEPNTAMAVTLDVGEWNDIHPLNKKSVGDRLALAAQKLAYQDNSVVYSGPLARDMSIQGNKILLNFDHIGSGLTIAGNELQGFSIAGVDGKYIWAKAKIVDKQIQVWNDQILNPIKVRYAWADNPSKANLINKEGLPASSFQLEHSK